MDKTEELAAMVIAAVQVFIDKKMAPMLEAIEGIKRELELRLTKDEAVRLFAGAEQVERQVTDLRGDLRAAGERFVPSADFVRAEAGAAAVAVLGAFPKPKDGTSVTADEVRPMLEQMVEQRVAAIPPAAKGEPGKDAQPEAVAAEVARQIALVPPPADGVSVDLGAIFAEIGTAVTRAVEALPKPKNGDSVTVEDVRPLIEKAIEDAVAKIPPPEPGKSVTVEDVGPLIDEVVRQVVADLPPAEPGKSVSPEDMRPMLAEMVAALPPPEPGKSVTVDDVRPMLAEMVAAIPVPKAADPVDYEFIGNQIELTVNNKFLNAPKPKDGADADPVIIMEMVDAAISKGLAAIPPPKDGTSVHPDTVRLMVVDAVDEAVTKAIAAMPSIEPDRVDMEEVRRLLADEVTRTLATWERPKDGDDGLGFDDMSMDLKEDGRTIVIRVSRDGREKVFEMIAPWQIYRGLYKSGARYQKGDTVTYSGSQFVAKVDTDKSPETDDWVLSVKRGKDAR